MAHGALQKIAFTIGVAPSSTVMLAEEMATDGTFLDRTSLLMLADDWFGKSMEKFLKVCNR